jgi:hypothetical protein
VCTTALFRSYGTPYVQESSYELSIFGKSYHVANFKTRWGMERCKQPIRDYFMLRYQRAACLITHQSTFNPFYVDESSLTDRSIA